MITKPTTFDLNVIYLCPKCASKHWFSVKELTGTPMLMCCDEVFEIQPIKNVELHFKYNSSVPKKALEILKDYGFTLDEINNSNVKTNNPEDFVKEFLAKQKK